MPGLVARRAQHPVDEAGLAVKVVSRLVEGLDALLMFLLSVNSDRVEIRRLIFFACGAGKCRKVHGSITTNLFTCIFNN